MIRVPDVRVFGEAVGERTKFGTVMMRPERWKAIGSLLLERLGRESGEDVAEEFAKQLGRHGLSTEDLSTALAGDSGVAVVVRAADDAVRSPLVILVGWLETAGEDAAGKLFGGVGSIAAELVEETADDPHPATRTDVELAGGPAIRLELPIVVEARKVGASHVFVTRRGPRLLFAAAMAVAGGQMQLKVNMSPDGLRLEPAVPDELPEGEGKPEEVARHVEASGDAARELFERFLARHDGPRGQGSGSPLADLLESPGMRSALAAGVPLVEVIVNPTVLGSIVGEKAGKMLEAIAPFGLDAVGPIAWRQSLDGRVWRSNAFVTLPAPRHGVMRLLDEPSDRPEVPSFLTREPIGFQQVSLDLGKAYSMLREAVLDGEEPPPGNAFGTAETTVLGLLGVDLPAALSALGTHHWFISYPPRIEEALAYARRLKAAGDDAAAAGPPPNTNPTAIVWQVEDEKPFAKLLELAAQSTGGKVVDEQGFRSVRLPAAGAIFLGQGHLGVAMGEGVAEKTLAAIRTPPATDDAFRSSDVVRRASEMVSPVSGGLYAVGDNQKTGGSLGLFLMIAAATAPDDVDEEYRDFFTALKQLLPSVDEIEGMLGASTVLLRSDASGIVLESATDMPAP